MQTKFATVVLLGFVLIGASACGGGGNDAAQIQEAVDKRIAEIEQEMADEEAALEEEATAEPEPVKEPEPEEDTDAEEIARLKKEAEDAKTAAAQAKQDAAEAIRKAERAAEAGQRGRGALTALEAVFDNSRTPNWAAPGATASVEIRETDIEIVASSLKGATRKSGNFYTATLSRTAPGVNQPERKIVVYSDREKSRTFANHYAQHIGAITGNSGVGGTKSNPRFDNSAWMGDLLSSDRLMFVSNPSRGGHPPTIAATATAPSEPKMVNTLSARVHGVSGHYGCHNGSSGAVCKVSVTAEYEPAGSAGDPPRKLTGLTIAPETGADNNNLYFDPGSGTISLLGGAPKPGVPTETDGQYITFGWWQERPAVAAADGTYPYKAAVFATATGGEYSGATGEADYEGPAAGLYVDLKSEGGKTIYESGDFTATAILRANFSDTPVVKGDVTDFKTTHGAKNWHVELESVTVGSTDAGVARIVQTGAASEGVWTHSFLQRHANTLPADVTDDQPIAVTGQFDARIPNVRHIVGAFGAHRITAPVE